MKRIDKMSRRGGFRLIVGGAVGIAVAAFMASCGGGGSSTPDPGTGGQATIDMAGITSVTSDISAFLPLCNPAAAAGAAVVGPTAFAGKVMAALDLRRQGKAVAGTQRRRLEFTSMKPADELGSCGGRMGYPSYSHASGVTTATLEFSDYCQLDPDTGERTLVDGSIAFVNTATPTATGPITTGLVADSPAGVTLQVRDQDGTMLSTQTMSFSGYRMTVGVPGGEPTAAAPDRYQMGELKITNNANGKTYRQTNWTVTDYMTASGGEETTVSGRGYRSNGESYDITTSTPLAMDAAGNVLGGTMSFTGAGGSTAVMTFVPGPVLQATMTVNGQSIASLPACVK
jgi:hypothetical protein